MGHEGPAGVDFGELDADLGANRFDDFLFVEKIDLALRGVHVHVHALGVDIKAQIGEWVPTLWKKGGVGLFEGFLDGGGLDRTVINEQQDSGFLHVIIGVGSVSRSGETPCLIGHLEGDEFVCDSRTVDLPDTIGCTGILGGGKTKARITMLFAGEGNAGAVDGIAADNIQNFGILFAGRSKSFPSRRHVVKEIFDLLYVSGSPSACVGEHTVI